MYKSEVQEVIYQTPGDCYTGGRMETVIMDAFILDAIEQLVSITRVCSDD
jgi:hypothetical protein